MGWGGVGALRVRGDLGCLPTPHPLRGARCVLQAWEVCLQCREQEGREEKGSLSAGPESYPRKLSTCTQHVGHRAAKSEPQLSTLTSQGA